jgi:hypothetical protein
VELSGQFSGPHTELTPRLAKLRSPVDLQRVRLVSRARTCDVA